LDNRLLSSMLASALAGMGGTGTGAAIAAAINALLQGKRAGRYIQHFIRWSMSFSSGLMLAVVCFDLLPQSFRFVCLVYGLLSAIVGTLLIPLYEACSSCIKRNNSNKMQYAKKHYYSTGMMIALGIAIHNFPEGLVVGSGFSIVRSYGIGISIIIALHDIPEGTAMAVPLLSGGSAPKKVILLSMLTGMPTIIGAVVGWIITGISPFWIGLCLGFAAGAMTYVVLGQLVPLCFNGKPVKGTVFFAITGFFIGILLSRLI